MTQEYGFTDLGYTGQRNYASFGLMDYNARFYSPALGRFTQPDTLIPDLTNTQSWNRFSYVNNSPIIFNDPTGHYMEGACGFGGGDCGDNSMDGYDDYESPDSGDDGTDGDGGGGDQPGNIDEDASAGYPAFEPASAPEWLPDFMAREYRLMQNAIWIMNHPGATDAQTTYASNVLAGYITGYGSLLVGLGLLGYAAADAILWQAAKACLASQACATATGIGGAVAEKACSDGDCTNEVDFIVTANGEAIPVPQGATGPTPTTGPGFQFTGGNGGNGLNFRVTDVRIMDPVLEGKYIYPNGYVNYLNASGQGVNPFTGVTISKSHDLWHIILGQP
jgi:RHS repeat-associated protein